MSDDWVVMAPGVKRRIREDGEHLMLVEVHLDDGAVVPEHAHVNEQITYVISGHLAFKLDGKDVDLPAGSTLRMPSNVRHGVTALEPSVVLDLFSPPREDFRK